MAIITHTEIWSIIKKTMTPKHSWRELYHNWYIQQGLKDPYHSIDKWRNFVNILSDAELIRNYNLYTDFSKEEK